MEAYQAGQDPRDPASWRASATPPPLAPSGEAAVEFTFTPAELGLSGFGVYPMPSRWSASTPGPAGPAQRTFLTYVPKNTKVPRTKLAIVLPHRRPAAPRPTTDTFIDDEPAPRAGRRQAPGRPAEDRAGHRARQGRHLGRRPRRCSTTCRRWPSRTGLSKGSDRQAPRRPRGAPWLDGTAHRSPDASGRGHAVRRPRRGRAGPPGPRRLSPRSRSRMGGRSPRRTSGATCRPPLNWPVNGLLDHDALDLLAIGGVEDRAAQRPEPAAGQTPPRTPDAAATLQSVNGAVDRAGRRRRAQRGPSGPSPPPPGCAAAGQPAVHRGDRDDRCGARPDRPGP